MGASSLSYAQARWSETLPDWIECHVQALEFFGGAPALLVPDNAKVAIIKACHFNPQVNRTYSAMAAHYGSAVLPTRPRRPRDKAKVEAAVRIVERWLLGRLRHRTFYNLAEVNAAIADLLNDLNDRRVLRRVGVTRRQLFEELDRPALRPLPVERYVFAEWRIRRAGLPRRDRAALLLRPLSLRSRASRGAHHRQYDRDLPQRRTDSRSSPLQRQRQAHDDPRPHALGPPPFCRLDDRTHSTRGHVHRAEVALLCEKILSDRPHPEQGFRACMGIIRLNKGFGRDRVNAACSRALEIGARTYGSVRSILDNHLDRAASTNGPASHEPIHHENIRGPRYYH